MMKSIFRNARILIAFCGIALLLFQTGCASSKAKRARSHGSHAPQTRKYVETGTACWYGKEYHGKKTASGETYNMNEMTAAHRSLPFNTKVRVTNLDNRTSVVVRINDRGPFQRDRIIDLSRKAARLLGIEQAGLARVRIETLP